MKRTLLVILALSLATPALACFGCGGSSPWQHAEGPAGMNLGRLRRVYSSKYNQPVKIEEAPPQPTRAEPPRPSSGSPLPTERRPPLLPKANAPTRPKT